MSITKTAVWGLRLLAGNLKSSAERAYEEAQAIREKGYEEDIEAAYSLGFAEGLSTAKRNASQAITEAITAMVEDGGQR